MALGYLFVALTFSVGFIKGFCGKKSSGLITTYRGSMLIGLVRMTLGVLIGYLIVLLSGNAIYMGSLNTPTVIFAVLAGVGQAGMIVTWLISARLGSLMLLEVFNLLGTVLSVLMCLVCFGDPVSVWQWIAMGMLMAATYLMMGYSRSERGKMTPTALVILIIGAITTGLSTFAQKGLKFYLPADEMSLLDDYTFVFNFYTYVAAACVLLVAFLATSRRRDGASTVDEPSPFSQVFRPRPMIYVTIMATCLFAYSLFQTLAGGEGRLDPAQVYPLTQGGGMVTTALMAAIFFGERLNKRSISAMALATAALVIMQVFKA